MKYKKNSIRDIEVKAWKRGLNAGLIIAVVSVWIIGVGMLLISR